MFIKMKILETIFKGINTQQLFACHRFIQLSGKSVSFHYANSSYGLRAESCSSGFNLYQFCILPQGSHANLQYFEN